MNHVRFDGDGFTVLIETAHHPVRPELLREAAKTLLRGIGFPDAAAYLAGAAAERDLNAWPSKAYQKPLEVKPPTMDIEAASARLASRGVTR